MIHSVAWGLKYYYIIDEYNSCWKCDTTLANYSLNILDGCFYQTAFLWSVGFQTLFASAAPIIFRIGTPNDPCNNAILKIK